MSTTTSSFLIIGVPLSEIVKRVFVEYAKAPAYDPFTGKLLKDTFHKVGFRRAELHNGEKVELGRAISPSHSGKIPCVFNRILDLDEYNEDTGEVMTTEEGVGVYCEYALCGNPNDAYIGVMVIGQELEINDQINIVAKKVQKLLQERFGYAGATRIITATYTG